MKVNYHQRKGTIRYLCRNAHRQTGRRVCQSFGANRLELGADLGERIQHSVRELGRRKHLVVREVGNACQYIGIATPQGEVGLFAHTASFEVSLSVAAARSPTVIGG